MDLEREGRLTRLARKQHYLFTREDARDVGFDRHAIARRVAAGIWSPVHPQVLVRGAPDLSREQELCAATLQVPGSRVSHRSALWLRGMCDRPGDVHVLAKSAPRSNPEGILVHRTRDLPPEDCAVLRGIPTTTPERALIDALTYDAGDAEALFDTCLRDGSVSARRLDARARALAAPRRRGCAVVLDLLATTHQELGRTRGAREPALLRMLEAAGLARPRVGYRVTIGGRRFELDFAWPEQMVALEYDGFAFHRTRTSFDTDRERQNLLVAAGWTIFRLTETLLRTEGAGAFAPLRALLA